MKMLLEVIDCWDIVETSYEMLTDAATEAALSNEKKESIAKKLRKR